MGHEKEPNNVLRFPRGGRDTLDDIEELQRIARQNQLCVRPGEFKMSDSPLFRQIVRGSMNANDQVVSKPTLMPEQDPDT